MNEITKSALFMSLWKTSDFSPHVARVWSSKDFLQQFISNGNFKLLAVYKTWMLTEQWKDGGVTAENLQRENLQTPQSKDPAEI